jgi:hypothetical protein
MHRFGWVLLAVACGGGDDDDGTPKPTDPSTPTSSLPTTSTPPTTPTTPSTTTPPTGTVASSIVRVVTLGDGLPLTGAEILVSDAAGAEVALATTDAAGEARVEIPLGGSVTYAQIAFGETWIETVADVPPGGDVAFVSRAFQTTDPGVGPVLDLTVSATGSPRDADRWLFSSQCDGANANTPGPFVLTNEQCPGRATDSVLAQAFDADDALVAWGAALDFRLDGDVVVEVPLDRDDVLGTEVAFRNLPAAATEVSGSWSPRLGDWSPVSASERESSPATEETYVLSVPALPFDSHVLQAFVTVGPSAYLMFAARSSTPPTGLVADLAGVALVSVAPVGGTPDRPEISFVATAGDRGDYGLARVAWRDAADETFVWECRFDPDSRGSVTRPAFPASWGIGAPAALFPPAVFLQEYAFLDGYPDAAAWQGDFPTDYDWWFSTAEG